MKLLSNLATLSIAASLVLQSGNFVSATPFFNVPTDTTVHSNDASLDANSCDGFRVTYPFSSGLTFEEESKHVVAWQAPSGMKQVNVTLVDTALADSQAYIGLFDANQGATEEFPLSLGDKDAGEYRFHLSAQGGSQYCEADSVPFQITKRAVPEATTEEDDSNTDDTQEDDNVHEDDTNWDSALSKVTTLTSEDNHNNDASAETDDSQSFSDYINSLDQDYKPYLDKNKETETEDVTHKNEAGDADSFGTAQDSTAETSTQKASWHSNDASSYFTNEDQSSNAAVYHNDSEWVNEDDVADVEHSNDGEWEEEVSDEIDHVDSNEFDDDVHDNLGEWYSDDDAHNNDWSSEDVDIAHANSYGFDFDNEDDIEDDDDEEATHNNGWVDEEDEQIHADGWSSAAIDVVDHPNYHVNDAEWSSSAEHTNEDDTVWESEEVDVIDHPNFHANDGEWEESNEEEFTGDGEHVNAAVSESNWVSEDAEHSNDGEWEEEVSDEIDHVDSNEFDDDVHDNLGEWYSDDDAHNNDWSSEDVDIAHANSYGFDFDNEDDIEDDDDEEATHNNGWVDEEDEQIHADGWVASAVDVVDHPNYHVNDAEWSSSAEHANEDDTVWESEDVDMADHPNFHANDGEWEEDNEENSTADGLHINAAVSESNWVSEDAEHSNDGEWEEEVSDEIEHVDNNEFNDDVHDNLGEWYSNDNAHNNDWSSEDVEVTHANSYDLDFDYEDEANDEDDEETTHSNGWVDEEDEQIHADGWSSAAIDVVDHPNYHVNDAEWSSSAEHTNEDDTVWESEEVDVIDHPNFHANDGEWEESNEEEFTGDGEHVNAAVSESNWVSEDAEHANAVESEWVSEDAEHTNDGEWEEDNEEEFTGDGEHVNAVVSGSNWVSEDAKHANAVESESEWVSNDDYVEHDNYYIRNADHGSPDKDHRTSDGGWDFSDNNNNNNEKQLNSDNWINNELNSIFHRNDSPNWVSEVDEHDNDVPSWVEDEDNIHTDDIPEEVALLQDDFAYESSTEHNDASEQEWSGY